MDLSQLVVFGHPNANKRVPLLSIYSYFISIHNNFRRIISTCRIYARQFHYPEYLFDRMYVFQYFGSPDPLDRVPGSFDQMDIMNILIINNISAELMCDRNSYSDMYMNIFWEFTVCITNLALTTLLPIWFILFLSSGDAKLTLNRYVDS